MLVSELMDILQECSPDSEIGVFDKDAFKSFSVVDVWEDAIEPIVYVEVEDVEG